MLVTSDDVSISAVHLESESQVVFVVAHGFTGSWRYQRVRKVLRTLNQRAGVIGFDFRGHGESSGKTTVGLFEVNDLRAVVRWAHELGYQKVVTLGFSMGGAVAIRYGTGHGDVDAVVSVSAPAFWFYQGTIATRRVARMIGTSWGRGLTSILLKTRIEVKPWLGEVPDAPVEAARDIPPHPLLIVHGDQDHYFPPEHGLEIYHSAVRSWHSKGEVGFKPELWQVDGFAHAELSTPPELTDRISEWALRALDQ
jgi:pimeloyl-ACP methyl ester carboxylesterase